MRTANTTLQGPACWRWLDAQHLSPLPHNPRRGLLLPPGSQGGEENGGTERLNNSPTSHSTARTLTQSSWIS